jgi:5-methylcytosine-specific restriction endonuclease McrA
VDEIVFSKSDTPIRRADFAGTPSRAKERKIGSHECPCVNCDTVFAVGNHGSPFCSVRCRSVAKAVRYVRARISDGTFGPTAVHPDPDIANAVTTKVAQALAEGYDATGRSIPVSLRADVIARDEGSCVMCGAPGAEIDHIEGSTPSMENLRLLCASCHHRLTDSHIHSVDPADLVVIRRYEDMVERWLASTPLRACDVADWEWLKWCQDHKRPVEVQP